MKNAFIFSIIWMLLTIGLYFVCLYLRGERSLGLYPAWMAAHPEVKDLTQEQWRKLWDAGLLKPSR